MIWFAAKKRKFLWIVLLAWLLSALLGAFIGVFLARVSPIGHVILLLPMAIASMALLILFAGMRLIDQKGRRESISFLAREAMKSATLTIRVQERAHHLWWLNLGLWIIKIGARIASVGETRIIYEKDEHADQGSEQ